jgi:hypothetical protein
MPNATHVVGSYTTAKESRLQAERSHLLCRVSNEDEGNPIQISRYAKATKQRLTHDNTTSFYMQRL